MLEVNDQVKNGTHDKSSKANTKVNTQTTEKETQKPSYNKKPDFKVVIDDADFNNNLKKHRLKNYKEEIKKEKSRIEKEIEKIKKMASLKIVIGIFFVAIGAYRIFIGFNSSSTKWLEVGSKIGSGTKERVITNTKETIGKEHYMHIASILFGLYLISRKKNHIKRSKK